MNESQTRLLIQRELDGNLSQEEENRLRRVLMVNDSAVSFRANLSQIVAAARDLELPDEVRPCDSSQLAEEIIDNLPVTKVGFWDPLLEIFANRKSGKPDPRSTRSVGSSTTHRAASGISPTGISFPDRHISQNRSTTGTTSSARHAISKIDPAVLNPDKNAKEKEKEKTPYGLPAVDQYITGTHPTLGGLAKKLGKNLNNAPIEDVGKTLADAIREKVHESHNAIHDEGSDSNPPQFETDKLAAIANFYDEPVTPATSEISEIFPESIAENILDNFPPEMPQSQSAQPPVFDSKADNENPAGAVQPHPPESLLPVSAIAPNIVPANITTAQLATTVNLGNSLVLTVGAQPPVSVQPAGMQPQPTSEPFESIAARGHDFSAAELEWKSGSYPTVMPPAKQKIEVQTETGPLAPFPFNNAPAIAKFNLKDTTEIMNQLAAESLNNPWAVSPTTAEPKPTAIPAVAPQNKSWTAAPIKDPWQAVSPPADYAWVPPPTPANPAAPADPWAPPLAQAKEQAGNPWAPQPVSSATPPATVPAVQQNPFFVPPVLPVSNPEKVAAPADPVTAVSPIAQISPVVLLRSEAAKAQPAKEVVAYEPTIVPVTRSTLPIEAINDRIDRLLDEPVDSKPVNQSVPPGRQEQPVIPVTGPLETSVSACLSSVGRLVDIRYATNNPGNINNLGRFLLTDETMESIGNCINKGLHQSSARVVTLEAAQQMALVLEPVVKTRGVLGYLVCGYDGLLVTHKLPPEVDVEMLGGCALVTYMNSHSIMKVMGHQGIKQMICQTAGGCMLLADFGKGFLVTLTSENDPGMLATLSDTIALISAA